MATNWGGLKKATPVNQGDVPANRVYRQKSDGSEPTGAYLASSTIDLGAKGDFSADDTAAFTAANAAANAGAGTITPIVGYSKVSAHYQIPGYQYPAVAGDKTRHWHLHGEGWSILSIGEFANAIYDGANIYGSGVKQMSTSGGALYYAEQPNQIITGFHGSNFAIVGPGVSGEHGIDLTNAVTQIGGLDHVGIFNFDSGLILGGVENWHCDRLTVGGCNVGITDGAGQAPTILEITKLWLQANGVGLKVISGGWWTIGAGTIQAGTVGIQFAPAGGPGTSITAPKMCGIWFENNDIDVQFTGTAGSTIQGAMFDHCRAGSSFWLHDGSVNKVGGTINDCSCPYWCVFLSKYDQGWKIDGRGVGYVLDYNDLGQTGDDPSLPTAYTSKAALWADWNLDCSRGATVDGSNIITAWDSRCAAPSSPLSGVGGGGMAITTLTVPFGQGAAKIMYDTDGSHTVTNTTMTSIGTRLAGADAPWVVGIQAATLLDPGASEWILFELLDGAGDTQCRMSVVKIDATHYQIKITRSKGATAKSVNSSSLLSYEIVGTSPNWATYSTGMIITAAFVDGVITIYDENGTAIGSGDGSIPGLTGAPTLFNFIKQAPYTRPSRFLFVSNVSNYTNKVTQDKQAQNLAVNLACLWRRQGYIDTR